MARQETVISDDTEKEKKFLEFNGWTDRSLFFIQHMSSPNSLFKIQNYRYAESKGNKKKRICCVSWPAYRQKINLVIVLTLSLCNWLNMVQCYMNYVTMWTNTLWICFYAFVYI